MAVNINVRWADNTKELAAALKAGTTEINATKQSVEKMVAAFSGDKLIAFAHKATAAINEVGAATLTASEAARNLSLLDRAMEKLSLTSKPIPEDMARTAAELRDVVAAAKSAEKGTGGLIGQFTTLVSALQVSNLIERATGMLVDWGKESIATAGRLVDLSAKTGLTTETIQRMEFVGKQAGVSVESFADAAFRLGTRLAGGSGSVRDAVAAVGLSFETLKNQKPDEQFNAVVKALESMSDSQERNRIGVELFGKSFASIAAAVASGYTDMASQAKVASDAQLKAIDDAADAWDRFISRQKTAITSWLGNAVIAHDTVSKLTAEQASAYQALLRGGGDAQGFLLDIAKKLAAQHDINLPKEKQQVDYTTAYSQALRDAKAEVDSLTLEERREIVAAEKLGKTHDEIADRFGLSEGALRLLNEETREGVKAQHDHESELKKSLAATEKYAEAVARTKDKIGELEAVLPQLTHSVGQLDATELKSIDSWLKMNDAAEKLRNTLRALQRDDFAGVAHGLENVGTKVPILSDAQKRAIEASKATSAWADGLGVAAQALYDLGQISGGTFGAILQGSASMLGAMQQVVTVMGKANASAAELTQSYLNLTFAAYQFIDAILKEREAARIRLDQENALFDLYKKYPGLSREVAEAIRNMSITPSGLVGPTDLEEALHLNGIIRDLGGIAKLTAAEMVMVNRGFDTLFTLINGNGPYAKEALDTLDSTLADMGASATKSGGLVSQFFLDMLAKARAAGIELEKVNAFLLEQTKTNIVGGLGAFVAGGRDAAKNLDDVRKQMAAIKDERDDLQRRGVLGDSDKKRLDELNKQWADLEAKAKSASAVIAAGVVTSQSAATALGASVMAAFEEMRRQGVPISEIMEKLGPIIDELGKKFDAAGFTGGAAFDAVREMAALAKDEIAGPIIDGINGLGQAMMGLHNIGALDADTFLGLTRQAKDMYNSLAAQGKGGVAALRLMQPALQTIWALHKDTGMAIDDETQALLDEAEANGIVGDKMRPIQEQQLIATNRIADAVEALAEVFGVLPAAAKDAADGISDKLSKIKIPKIKIPYEWDSEPGGAPPYIPAPPAPPKPVGPAPYRPLGSVLDGVPQWSFTGLTSARGSNTFPDWVPAGDAASTTTQTAGRNTTVVLQERLALDFSGSKTIDGTDLVEFIEKAAMPLIVGELEDRRRGYAARIAAVVKDINGG